MVQGAGIGRGLIGCVEFKPVQALVVGQRVGKTLGLPGCRRDRQFDALDLRAMGQDADEELEVFRGDVLELEFELDAFAAEAVHLRLVSAGVVGLGSQPERVEETVVGAPAEHELRAGSLHGRIRHGRAALEVAHTLFFQRRVDRGHAVDQSLRLGCGSGVARAAGNELARW